MPPTSEDVYKTLQSIDATLKELLALSKSKRAAQQPQNQAPKATTQTGQFQGPPDADLDGPHGNPFIKMKDPRDWTGPTMVGKTFSQCPPEYLDMMADRYDYFAANGEPQKAAYNRRDAALCRGWAARLRAGWKPPQTDTPDPEWGGDDGIKW